MTRDSPPGRQRCENPRLMVPARDRTGPALDSDSTLATVPTMAVTRTTARPGSPRPDTTAQSFPLSQRVGHLAGEVRDLARAVIPPVLEVTAGTVQIVIAQLIGRGVRQRGVGIGDALRRCFQRA